MRIRIPNFSLICDTASGIEDGGFFSNSASSSVSILSSEALIRSAGVTSNASAMSYSTSREKRLTVLGASSLRLKFLVTVIS